MAMAKLEGRKRNILNKMGVELWVSRNIDQADKGESPLESPPESPPESTNAALETTLETTLNVSNAAPEIVESPVKTRKSAPSKHTVKPIDGGLESIAAKIKKCQDCDLHKSRKNAVPGCGNGQADWMFIGEAPGRNEDEQGLPFVGRSGQLLNAMIQALNMNRDDAFIANVIKCRPPDNRDPLAEEVDRCESYLHHQLAVIKPKIIVSLGRVSAQALLKTVEPLGQMRGKVYHYGAESIPLIVTYHPAYLLRSPLQKAKVWQDLLLAKSVIALKN